MEDKVLDIITENLTNERLDYIILQDGEYTEADSKARRQMQIFENSLDREQQKKFDGYLSAENSRMAIYVKKSYEQGQKDIIELLSELTEKKITFPLQ